VFLHEFGHYSIPAPMALSSLQQHLSATALSKAPVLPNAVGPRNRKRPAAVFIVQTRARAAHGIEATLPSEVRRSHGCAAAAFHLPTTLVPLAFPAFLPAGIPVQRSTHACRF